MTRRSMMFVTTTIVIPRRTSSRAAEKSDFRFLRFRPPKLEREGTDEPTLPHIRLDRALQFLIGDKLS